MIGRRTSRFVSIVVDNGREGGRAVGQVTFAAGRGEADGRPDGKSLFACQVAATRKQKKERIGEGEREGEKERGV